MFNSKQKNEDVEFKVFEGKTFELYKIYFDRRFAKLKAEEMKITGDINNYRVEEAESDGFLLWVH